MTGMTVGQINEMTQGYPKLVRRVEKLERAVAASEHTLKVQHNGELLAQKLIYERRLAAGEERATLETILGYCETADRIDGDLIAEWCRQALAAAQRAVAAGEERVRALEAAVVDLAVWPLHSNDVMRKHADTIASARAALAAASPEAAVTHGRHCPCGPCQREDWTNPSLAPCGMHPKGCPPEAAEPSEAGLPTNTDRVDRQLKNNNLELVLRWVDGVEELVATGATLADAFADLSRRASVWSASPEAAEPSAQQPCSDLAHGIVGHDRDCAR